MTESLDPIQIRADELCDGKLVLRCPCCRHRKDINDFGLRRDDTGRVFVHETCRTCRDPELEVVQIKVDELRDGKLHKRCPHCGVLKEINEFGLRRKQGAGRNGVDVIAAQAWCKTCRPLGGKPSESDPDTDEK